MSRRFWFLCIALILAAGVGVPAIELPDEIKQLPNGQIIFPVKAAKAQGNSRTWSYKPTRWGKYYVEGVFTGSGRQTFNLKVEIGTIVLTGSGRPDGNMDQYRTLRVSEFYLPEARAFEMRATTDKVEDLQAIMLRPAPEGKPIVQTEESLVLHARDAITHSVMMRYEPATNKNCLGYWTVPTDTAEWKFRIAKPGSYQIEVWQGCGKGQGGSDVTVEVAAGERLLKEAQFTVEDTGHFQNFVPRRLGIVRFDAAGDYSLKVKPQNRKAAAVLDIRQIALLPVTSRADVSGANPAMRDLLSSGRVVFLGDSITYSGEYIEFVETYVRLKYPEAEVEFINLGLPSETVSGFSEPGHAGGLFRRPVLRERSGNVFKVAKPDLIFACYGMNDGVYYPYSEERMIRFQEGISTLQREARTAKTRIVFLTPPTFDPVPLKGKTLPAGLDEYKAPFEEYNDVLDKYSGWIMSQGKRRWEVIDVHSSMNKFLEEQRRKNPKFVLAPDGVHANEQGHWLIAREILRYYGAPAELTSAPTSDALLKSSPRAPEMLKLVQQRQRVLKDAWLTRVGHSRPGMNKGKPLPEAERESNEIGDKIRKLK